MALQRVSQVISKLRMAIADARLLNDLFVALRESIAPLTTALSASTVWDPPSVAAGSTTNTTFAVAGAQVGDFVLVAPGISTAGMLHSGYVSSAGNVTIAVVNTTGGAVDLASSTWRVLVIPQGSVAKLANFAA